MSSSILPANLSDLERDLDAALSRIAEVDIPIAQLWDPWLCPVEVLPYLAWAVSVDQWRSDWSEQTKRRVVANSRPVHRIKGTRPAVAKALEAVGVSTDLKEWFETDPPLPPGTFMVGLEIVDQGLTEGTLESLEREIISVKPARAHFTTRMIGLTRGAIGYGCASFAGENTEVLPYSLTELAGLPAVSRFAVGYWDYMATTIYPQGTV